MVLNATFNNISVISWRSVLLVEDTGVPWENHWPVTNHRQPVSYNVVSSTPHLSGIQNCNVSLDRHWLWLKWLNNIINYTSWPTILPIWKLSDQRPQRSFIYNVKWGGQTEEQMNGKTDKPKNCMLPYYRMWGIKYALDNEFHVNAHFWSAKIKIKNIWLD